MRYNMFYWKLNLIRKCKLKMKVRNILVLLSLDAILQLDFLPWTVIRNYGRNNHKNPKAYLWVIRHQSVESCDNKSYPLWPLLCWFRHWLKTTSDLPISLVTRQEMSIWRHISNKKIAHFFHFLSNVKKTCCKATGTLSLKSIKILNQIMRILYCTCT